MTEHKKPTYIIIQEAMVERIRFLEDELYNRAYKDIERQEAEIDRLKEKCVNLMLENADYLKYKRKIDYMKGERIWQ